MIQLGYLRAPRAIPAAGLVGGTLLVTFGTYFTGQDSSPYPLFYIWIGLFSFYFLRRSVARPSSPSPPSTTPCCCGSKGPRTAPSGGA